MQTPPPQTRWERGTTIFTQKRAPGNPPSPKRRLGKGTRIANPPLDMMGKGDHNFFTEKGVRQPPTPVEQIGKGDHNFYKERTGRGHLKKVEFP